MKVITHAYNTICYRKASDQNPDAVCEKSIRDSKSLYRARIPPWHVHVEQGVFRLLFIGVTEKKMSAQMYMAADRHAVGCRRNSKSVCLGIISTHARGGYC